MVSVRGQGWLCVGVWALPASGNGGEFVMSAQVSWCVRGRTDR